MTIGPRIGGDRSGDAIRQLLIEQAREGDSRALDLVAMALPDPLPAAIAHRYRNGRIRQVAAWLRARPDAPSENRIAAIIAAAAKPAGSVPLAHASAMVILTPREIATVVDMLRPIAGDGEWLGERQVRRIIAGISDIEVVEVSNVGV